jgi:hypothetical protein
MVSDKYGAMFSALPNLVAVVGQLGAFQQDTLCSRFAQYLALRGRGAGSTGFLIYLVLAEDGIWRVDGMRWRS